MSDLKPSTLAAQALGWRDPVTGAVVPSVIPSAPYERAPDGSYQGGHTYTRDQNPTYEQPEALLAALEGGVGAKLFSSGMAAATTVFETLESGAHVVAPRQMYWTIRRWLEQLAAGGRIALDFVPNDDPEGLRATVRPGQTKIVWVETPSNPTCDITDITASAEIAHAAGARVVVDGTVATPVLCQPLALGADLVMHSATKQLNGHSDVLAGALVARTDDELWTRIGHDRSYRGAVLGPFEAWLLLRGMRTLFLRVPAAARNAQRVAEMLAQHPGVVHVMYPGLPSHPGHAVATRQMHGGYGMMLSFRPAGGESVAKQVVGALKLFRNATSLGGVESLVEHRAPVEGPGTTVPNDLVRLSLGIEDAEDLVSDLRQALASVATLGVSRMTGDGDLKIEKATATDAGVVLSLIKDLAIYENMSDEVVATEADIRRALSSPAPSAEALIARLGGDAVGFALFFHNFSTFLGRSGLYLEDLFVKPEWRSRGVGHQLLVALARLAVARRCGRMEWSVLDWNELAMKSYRRVGAAPLNEWTTWRLTGGALESLAAEPFPGDRPASRKHEEQAGASHED